MGVYMMKIKKAIKFVAVFAGAFMCLGAYAEVWLPKIFSDNMVVQRDVPFKIWGKAKAGSKVGVLFGEQRKMATVGKDGSWEITFNGLPASKDPMTIEVWEAGKKDKEIKNVLVGEVWVLGGQSNMAMKFSHLLSNEYDKYSESFKKELENAGDSKLIRCFIQREGAAAEKPQDEFPKNSAWLESNPENAKKFSLVGYYFAKQLVKDLDVPVGLIHTARGGSSMIAWIPEENLEKTNYTKARNEKYKKAKSAYNYEDALKKYDEEVAKYNESVKKAKAEKKKIPSKPASIKRRPEKLTPWTINTTPSYLYNAKVAPLAGFPVKGFLWYQGEADSSGDTLKDFIPQFKTVIESWRDKWGDDKLPFLFVQLTSYSTKSDYPMTRWQQFLATKNIERAYMANIIDLGLEKNIHPPFKDKVGERLEKIAMREVYGDSKVMPYGPIFKQVKYDPRGALVSFDVQNKRLVGKGKSRGFEVKLKGGWIPAEAFIDGKSGVAVYAKDRDRRREKIEGVRYLWKNWAGDDVWLYDGADLPAMSFTDELVEQNKK